jgi:hypothetical protein
MANTHQAMDCTDQRRPSIGERFPRFIGFPAEMPQMDPAELKAVLALRGSCRSPVCRYRHSSFGW